jgi:hypothetical protein
LTAPSPPHGFGSHEEYGGLVLDRRSLVIVPNVDSDAHEQAWVPERYPCRDCARRIPGRRAWAEAARMLRCLLAAIAGTPDRSC